MGVPRRLDAWLQLLTSRAHDISRRPDSPRRADAEWPATLAGLAQGVCPRSVRPRTLVPNYVTTGHSETIQPTGNEHCIAPWSLKFLRFLPTSDTVHRLAT